MFRGREYVYEVYKEKSFSKAAHNLYISQPSLSATIRKIEQRIGMPIFDRSTVPIQLTECGKEYIKYMGMIMELENEFSNYVANLNGLKVGSIAIGCTNFFMSFIIPPIISEFTKRYPSVTIKLVESTTASLEEQLSEGMLDLVIDNYEFNKDIYSRELLYTENLILAVNKKFIDDDLLKGYQLSTEDIMSKRHLEASTEVVPLSHFKDKPFLLLRSGNDTCLRAEKICHSQGFNPNTILRLDQQITAYNQIGRAHV